MARLLRSGCYARTLLLASVLACCASAVLAIPPVYVEEFDGDFDRVVQKLTREGTPYRDEFAVNCTGGRAMLRSRQLVEMTEVFGESAGSTPSEKERADERNPRWVSNQYSGGGSSPRRRLTARFPAGTSSLSSIFVKGMLKNDGPQAATPDGECTPLVPEASYPVLQLLGMSATELRRAFGCAEKGVCRAAIPGTTLLADVKIVGPAGDYAASRVLFEHLVPELVPRASAWFALIDQLSAVTAAHRTEYLDIFKVNDGRVTESTVKTYLFDDLAAQVTVKLATRQSKPAGKATGAVLSVLVEIDN